MPSYSGYLLSASAVFDRPFGVAGDYYYQAIRITVSKSDIYTFTSQSSMDTYGYLYENVFDPLYPSGNLIASNDDGGGNQQFRFSVHLFTESSYVLIVTTYRTNTIGSFSIRVSGPSSVDLVPYKPTNSRPIRTTSECCRQHKSAIFVFVLQRLSVSIRAIETRTDWKHWRSSVLLAVVLRWWAASRQLQWLSVCTNGAEPRPLEWGISNTQAIPGSWEPMQIKRRIQYPRVPCILLWSNNRITDRTRYAKSTLSLVNKDNIEEFCSSSH